MEQCINGYRNFFWKANRSNDIISFLVDCRYYAFSRELFRILQLRDFRWQTFSTLCALCKLDILCLNNTTRPASLQKEIKYEYPKIVKIETKNQCCTLLESLAQIFNYCGSLFFDDEFYLNKWICKGWICAQSGQQFLIYQLMHSGISACKRIAKQLLVLGLFCQPEPQEKHKLLRWPFRYLYDEHKTQLIWCKLCCDWLKQETTEECRHVIPLVTEFFRNPLSLQQLSRIEIRRSIGMNDFKRRVKTLPLPPPLLTYVWCANEFLEQRKIYRG